MKKRYGVDIRYRKGNPLVTRRRKIVIAFFAHHCINDVSMHCFSSSWLQNEHYQNRGSNKGRDSIAGVDTFRFLYAITFP